MSERDEGVQRVPVVLRQVASGRVRGPAAHRDVGVLRQEERLETVLLGELPELGGGDRVVGVEVCEAELHAGTSAVGARDATAAPARGTPSAPPARVRTT